LPIIEHFLECTSRQEQRVSIDLAKKIASFAISRLKHYGPSTQQLTIEKTLSRSMIKDSLPLYSIELAVIKQSHKKVQHLKDGMNTHLVGLQQSKGIMAKDIVCIFAASQFVNSGRGLAKMFGVDRRNIKKGLMQRVCWTQLRMHSI